jgi:bifunctional DNA-binding transcriptional regulator/antitoxin component of YhaV-PrlF toxin-antitoxin module
VTKKEIRKVQQIQGSLYSNIPKDYADTLGIDRDDSVIYELDEKRKRIIIKKVEV